MPNVSIPRGLVPLREAGSGTHNGGLNMYFHPSADATALFIGDPVVKNGSSDTSGKSAAVVRAAAAGPITGVVQGFVPGADGVLTGSGAASTAYYLLVDDDPDAIFEIQDNTGLAAADIGLNASMTLGAGNTYSKRSGVTLDAATKAVTATLPLKIVALSARTDNDFGAFNKVLVKINNHTEANAVAGL